MKRHLIQIHLTLGSDVPSISVAWTSDKRCSLDPTNTHSRGSSQQGMSYDEISDIAQQIKYRDKLRLAQLLIQLARKEEEEQNPDRPAVRLLDGGSGRSPPYTKNPETLANVIDPNRPWVGRDYAQQRIFVVGSSSYCHSFAAIQI